MKESESKVLYTDSTALARTHLRKVTSKQYADKTQANIYVETVVIKLRSY
jgi:hypothetical protein